jgi:hypothetical protein
MAEKTLQDYHSKDNEQEFHELQLEIINDLIPEAHWHERRGFGSTMLKYINTHSLYTTANLIYGHGGWQRLETKSSLVKAEQVDKYLIRCTNHKQEMQVRVFGKGLVIACPTSGCTQHHTMESLANQFADREIYKVVHVVSYIATVTIALWNGKQWIHMTGVGGGESSDASIGKAHENALKEAETDATKRAFFPKGNSLGLGLYFDKQPNPFIETSKTLPSKSKAAPKRPAKYTTTGEKVEAHGWQQLKENFLNNCEAWESLTGAEPGAGLKQFRGYSFGPEKFLNMNQINKRGNDLYDWVQDSNDKVLEALDMLGDKPAKLTDEGEAQMTDEDIPF